MKPMSEWLKEEFLAAHLTVWQELINWLKTTPYDGIYEESFITIKRELSTAIAGIPVLHSCFGCAYSVRKLPCKSTSYCGWCLFGDFSGGRHCLGGMYNDCVGFIQGGELEEAVKLAIKIRDLPARKD